MVRVRVVLVDKVVDADKVAVVATTLVCYAITFLLCHTIIVRPVYAELLGV